MDGMGLDVSEQPAYKSTAEKKKNTSKIHEACQKRVVLKLIEYKTYAIAWLENNIWTEFCTVHYLIQDLFYIVIRFSPIIFVAWISNLRS